MTYAKTQARAGGRARANQIAASQYFARLALAASHGGGAEVTRAEEGDTYRVTSGHYAGRSYFADSAACVVCVDGYIIGPDPDWEDLYDGAPPWEPTP